MSTGAILASIIFSLWISLIVIRTLTSLKINSYIRKFDILKLAPKIDLFTHLRRHPPGLYYRTLDGEGREIDSWQRLERLDMTFRWYHVIFNPRFNLEQTLAVYCETIVYRIQEGHKKWQNTEVTMQSLEYKMLAHFVRFLPVAKFSVGIQFKVVEEVYSAPGTFHTLTVFTSPALKRSIKE